jgi:predicted lipoprotein with Yx(FWY)xxD motif
MGRDAACQTAVDGLGVPVVESLKSRSSQPESTSMHRFRTRFALLVAATLLLSACTSGAGVNPAATAAPAASAAAASTTVSAATAGSLGAVLTGPDGLTLYTHEGDSTNASTCTGSCLTEWPPLTAAAGQQVTAGRGVTGKLGSFARSDGTQWITYGGLPLYYWVDDSKPGDATGQGIDGFVVAAVSGTSAAPGDAASPSTKGDYGY